MPSGFDPMGGYRFSEEIVLKQQGALLLTLFAYVWHRWLHRQPLSQPWPQHWL